MMHEMISSHDCGGYKILPHAPLDIIILLKELATVFENESAVR